MCTIIMTVLPADSDLIRAKETYTRFGLGFWEVHADRPNLIQSGDHYIAANAGHCDCGTVLGYAGDPEIIPRNPADEIPKLKKKGWSNAKIERWLSDKLRHPDRHEVRRKEELAKWLNFIPHVLESGIASRLGVFVHFYHKELNANIIRQIEHVPLKMLTPELLRNMADDTLYEFAPDRVRG